MRRKIRTKAVTLKYLQSIPKKGGGYYNYARAPGKERVTLPDLPLNDPIFLKAYAEAVGEPVRPPRRKSPNGALSAVINAFLLSEPFKKLSPDYGRVIRREVLEIHA